MFKVNNKNTSDNKDTSVFIVNFENISHLVLVFLLLTLSMLQKQTIRHIACFIVFKTLDLLIYILQPKTCEILVKIVEIF